MSWIAFDPNDPAVVITDTEIRLNPAARDLARLFDAGSAALLIDSSDSRPSMAIGVALEGEFAHPAEESNPSGWLTILAAEFIRQVNVAPGRYRADLLKIEDRHLIEVWGLREKMEASE
jgi:hypothetical protein